MGVGRGTAQLQVGLPILITLNGLAGGGLVGGDLHVLIGGGLRTIIIVAALPGWGGGPGGIGLSRVGEGVRFIDR